MKKDLSVYQYHVWKPFTVSRLVIFGDSCPDTESFFSPAPFSLLGPGWRN